MSFSRTEQLTKLENQEVFDLLILGGGIVGSAALAMASADGLNAILLEKNDFASGASSRSTKLLHGGIRYLPQLQFGLVRESLQETKSISKIYWVICINHCNYLHLFIKMMDLQICQK